MNKEFLSTREAANVLGIPEHAVRDLCRRNLLEGSVKDPRNSSWRIPTASVDKWKNQNPSKPINPSGKKTWKQKIPTESKWLAFYGSIIVAVLSLIGIVGAARIQSNAAIKAAKMQVEVPIQLTQTAEANRLLSSTQGSQTNPGRRIGLSSSVIEHPLTQYGFPTHIVLPGETLGSISTRYRTSVNNIVFANSLYEPISLALGMELVIPGIYIEDIIGGGSLQDEAVILLNPTSDPISLIGWTVSNDRGYVYTFGNVELFGEGAGVLVYTREGDDTFAKFFWGLDEALWESGSIATLRDHNLNVRSQFTIP